MEHDRFDTLTRGLAHGLTRRCALTVLTALTGASLVSSEAAEAKKKKKKVTICRNGQTLSVTKKKKQKHLQPGDTEGSCSPPAPPASPPASPPVSLPPGPPPSPPPPPPPPPPPTCPDVNPGDDLQAAIDAAASGSTLRLCPGTFKVTRYLEVEKDLTIAGAGRDETILDGEEKNGVLIVGGSRIVTVEDLTITRGNAGEGGKGGGIINNGDLTLRRTAVTFCKAFTGGGIMNFKNSVLTLDGVTNVERNTAGDEGGGIANDQATVLMKERSSVSNNTAQRNGGGILTFGTLTLNAGSFVEGNTAIDGDGGGIRHAVGPLTIDRRSTVQNNHPDNCKSLFGSCPDIG